jgi:hypothetical protein
MLFFKKETSPQKEGGVLEGFLRMNFKIRDFFGCIEPEVQVALQSADTMLKIDFLEYEESSPEPNSREQEEEDGYPNEAQAEESPTQNGHERINIMDFK